ncbi:MAG: Fur family transcriptional regulator [Christensenellales bacterium]
MERKTQIYQLLRDKGFRITAQKKKILDVFLDNPDRMLSVGDMNDLLEHNSSIDNATIYRNVQKFEKLGLLESMVDSKGYGRYMISDGVHHHHFICTSCGCIINFPCNTSLWSDLAKQFRFAESHHKIEIYGVCAQCRNV